MDCMCLKRKRRHRRDQKKFRPLTPHVSPTHSQPSTLGHPPDPRLPKVASNGLWLSTPSIYSGVPSPAYYYGPNAKHIQRASSETRIPQPRQQFIPSRPHFGSHNNVYIIPVPGQRIYHSQPLAPLYEVPPTHGSEIYDVYQFVGPNGISSNSRSKLIETRHTPGYYHDQNELRGGRRPERSKSDAQDRRHPRQDYSRQQGQQQQQQSRQPRQSSAERRERSSSNRDNASSRRSAGSSQGDQRISKSTESLKNSSSGSGGPRAAPSQVHKGHVNIAYYSPEAARTRPPPTSVPTSTIEVTHSFLPNGLSNTENMSPSATDSMKLLAKNKTDDQKTQPGLATIMVEKKNDEDRLKKEAVIRHYNYADDIYTLPTKSAEDTENPILDRMKEMVIEKSRASNRVSASDIPVAVTSDSGLYEVTKVTKVVKTEVTESYETNKDDLADFELPDISQLEKTQASDLPYNTKNALPVDNITTTTSAKQFSETAMKLNMDELPIPVTSPRDRNNVSPKLSVDTDGANDAKKITSEAFEFLEDYLDDDGTDAHVDSPPLSPGGMRVEGVVS